MRKNVVLLTVLLSVSLCLSAFGARERFRIPKDAPPITLSGRDLNYYQGGWGGTTDEYLAAGYNSYRSYALAHTSVTFFVNGVEVDPTRVHVQRYGGGMWVLWWGFDFRPNSLPAGDYEFKAVYWGEDAFTGETVTFERPVLVTIDY